MALSVYVHIPYCLQRCRYCDFTTFEQSEILPPDQYVGWVVEEIRHRHAQWNDREIRTLYFGGGTPSLLAPELIVTICRELANVGFTFQPGAERTIEINPATLTEAKLDAYLGAGFNRFSVGAQSFNDALLKMCGRKHDAQDTRETLKLLGKYHLNHSFDLLFALPGQSLADVRLDLAEVAAFAPPHLSAYCLTVPDGHPMSLGRPPEDEQIAMFDLIESELRTQGLLKYEISNFAKPGFESRHNLAYWQDVNYWGIGLSSHSYARDRGAFGTRFWNSKSLPEYGAQSTVAALPVEQAEALAEHEALTDFHHMFLRTTRGLPREALRNKFRPSAVEKAERELDNLSVDKLLVYEGEHWRLSAQGQLLSNRVFARLTFLPEDLPPPDDFCRPSGGLTRALSDTYCAV